MPLFNVYPLYDVTPVSGKGVAHRAGHEGFHRLGVPQAALRPRRFRPLAKLSEHQEPRFDQ